MVEELLSCQSICSVFLISFLPFAFLCVSAFLYSIDVAKAYVQVQVQQLPNDVVFLLVICCLIIHFSND